MNKYKKMISHEASDRKHNLRMSEKKTGFPAQKNKKQKKKKPQITLLTPS